MTTWKAPAEEEVTRVYEALLSASLTEMGLAEEWRYNVPEIPRPRRPGRARSLWDALMLAWAAWVRFERRTAAARSTSRGQPLASLEDQRRDQAVASVERALALLRNAEASLQADVDALRDLRKRYQVEIDPKEQKARVKRMADLADGVAAELANLKTVRGIRQIWTRREWDTFVSESAEALLGAGFSSREVAALLTGTPEEDVDRGTLERFRQRVRRRNDSGS